MTKIVKEFALTKETLEKEKKGILRKWVDEDCAGIGRQFIDLMAYVQKKIDSDQWFYIPQEEVFYVPCIASLIPNLNKVHLYFFRRSYYNSDCRNSYQISDLNARLEFSSFNGSIPTYSEADKCFGRDKEHFKNGGDLVVCGENRQGLVVEDDGNYYQFMLGYADYSKHTLGRDYGNSYSYSFSYFVADVPIYRLNGKDSADANAVLSLLLLYEKGLIIDDEFWTDRKIKESYKELGRLYAEYGEYLVADEKANNISIDKNKVYKDALSGTRSFSFIHHDVQVLLKSNKVSNATDYLKKLKDSLLNCDKKRADIDAYDENLLTDPNRGHWDLWDWNDNTTSAGKVVLKEGLTARNPEEDINNGIVAIDFGTKSTVVVYENENIQTLPLQVGCGNYGRGVQAKNYENPTIVQFIDLKSFIDSYNARAGRPYTKWEEVTVSHTAFENLSNSNSKRYYSFFDSLKQWCGADDQRVKIKDAEGYVCDLPPFMELEAGNINPIEIYAYYLGLYINNMLQEKHIFLQYIMSFPVTYDREVREKMRLSFEAGLRKSLPTALLNNKKAMEGFRVQEGASEPAAYAITALEEYGFAPSDDEEEYYAVFDFGGGTTDFDFGVQRESENDRYDYELIHFGANGDKTLGGENLLKLLAFEVFKKNKNALLKPEKVEKDNSKEKIPFTWAAEKKDFAGSEGLIKDSQEANLNMHNVMEALRPVWEKPETEVQNIVSEMLHGDSKKEVPKEEKTPKELKVNLYTDAGNQRPNYRLNIEGMDFQKLLRDRIAQGIENFFLALRKAFEQCSDNKHNIKKITEVSDIAIFLAGNSSKSALVKGLFEEYLEPNGKARRLLGLSADAHMPKFTIYPALGTEAAYKLMEEKGIEVEKDNLEKPTGKTGVAFGLLKCIQSGSTKVIDITPDSTKVQFQYYIGRNKKRKFRTIIDRSTKMNVWYRFIDASGDFDLLYTDQPIAATNDAPVTIAKRIHVTINNPQEDADVYIRPVNSHTLEYAIAKTDKELATAKKDSQYVTIELE